MSNQSRTWTFQPADDVVEAFKQILGEDMDQWKRGERSDLINQALRLQNPQALVAIAEKDLVAARQRVTTLRRALKIAKKSPRGETPSNSERAFSARFHRALKRTAAHAPRAAAEG